MPSALSRSLDLLRVPGNALGFLARSSLRWSRGTPILADENKQGLFEWLAPEPRGKAQDFECEQRAAFDLQHLYGRSSRLHYCESLALLETLERLLDPLELPLSPDGVLRALDVGCGAFPYATALQRFLGCGGTGPRRGVRLRGIEVDGHGLYRDGHSRADHALAHARLAGDGVDFQVADFLAQQPTEHDLVTLFYPFLTRQALLRWGLPLALFRPRALLHQAVAALRPGGLLVVANQTSEEFALLFDGLGHEPAECLRQASFVSQLVPYHERTEGRIGSVWRRG